MIEELLKILNQIDLSELGTRQKLEEEINRFHKFQNTVLKSKDSAGQKTSHIDIRTYAKYLLKEGSITEKRELLANLKSKLVYKDKTITLLPS